MLIKKFTKKILVAWNTMKVFISSRHRFISKKFQNFKNSKHFQNYEEVTVIENWEFKIVR
jgi:hypothetical protein